MDKIEIIEKIAKEKLVEQIIKNIAKKEDDLLNDCSQDIYVDLMAKDDELIENLYENKQLNYFITRMVINQIHSKNSTFYMRYKRFTQNMEGLKDE